MTTPLVNAIKGRRSHHIEWHAGWQKASEDPKQALCKDILLHTPNFSLPFTLQTDASGVALGAVLSQEVEGMEGPMAYRS